MRDRSLVIALAAVLVLLLGAGVYSLSQPAGGPGEDASLPPSSGRTQAGTTPSLAFRATLLGGGECAALDVVL